jgi:hypothetical protein
MNGHFFTNITRIYVWAKDSFTVGLHLSSLQYIKINMHLLVRESESLKKSEPDLQ